jgi:transcriptional regulator with XRE-family HTH domain
MTKDAIRRRELSDFLRTRRARVSADTVGLPTTPRRRTPGLRREEVAQLAGMSATWYTWLEQARPVSVSTGTLDSLARVLRLDATERVQLFQLALRQPKFESKSQRRRISPLLEQLLYQNERLPAFVMGPRWDVLTWNFAARAFWMDFQTIPIEERNLVWLLFTDPGLRSLLVDWPNRAQDGLARFRLSYGRYAGDRQFIQLVERLKSVSPEFAEWWPRHDVQPLSEGVEKYNHPLAGPLQLQHISFSPIDDPELTIVVMAPAPRGDSQAKLCKIIDYARSSTVPVPYSGVSNGHEAVCKNESSCIP